MIILSRRREAFAGSCAGKKLRMRPFADLPGNPACLYLCGAHHGEMNRADTLHGNEVLDPRLMECYRHATPGAKLAVVARLNETLITLKEAALRAAHPDLPPEKRRELLRRWWLGAAD